MSEFIVSANVDQVEVYVHNRYEHFKRTISRMSISKQVQTSINQVKLNLEGKIQKKLSEVIRQEKKYLMSIGLISKEKYYEEFSTYKTTPTNDIMQVFYNFTDLSASNYAELEKIYARRFIEEVDLQKGTGVQSRRREALGRIRQDIVKKNQAFMDSSEEFLENLLKEYANFTQYGEEANPQALNKRIEAMKTTWKAMTNSNAAPPKTLNEAKTQAGKLRKTTKESAGLGVSFEPVAGLVFGMFNDYLNDEFNAKRFSGKAGKKRIVADKNKDKQYTTDISVQVGEITVGIDIKSQSAIYLKDIERQAYANEVLAAMFLGEGGFSQMRGLNIEEGMNFGALIPNTDADFFKKLVYVLVNSSVFESDGGKLKQTDEVEKALRSILIIGGFIDFIATYLSKALNDSRSQILLFTGEKLIFTSDFIGRLVEMVKGINTENMGNLYGMRINMSDNEKSKIASNLKTDLLEQKLSLIRKNVNTYESLFRNAELRQSMQTITSKALQKTMTIHITAPIGTLFKGLGQ